MKYITYSALNNISYNLSNSKSKYYNDIITFDIETTSYNKYISFMYVWQICINGFCYYGRTWQEFKELIEEINEEIKYNDDKYIIIWVHNLSFEFRFMEKIFNFTDVFATSPHKVVYAKYGNIIFRCSYFMSNLPLYKLQSTYNLKTKKLKGDLDYTLIRHKSTILTEKDLQYCENDVLLLYEYIQYMLEHCGSFSPSKMPLTSTGFTRQYLREKARAEKQYKALRNIVVESSPTDLKLYNTLQRAFAGGYTHCNWIYCKQVVENVRSLDKTSFYPAIMCKEKFPREFHKMKSEKFYQLIKNPDYAVIADICFFNLRAKTTQSIISKHKCSYIKNGNYYYNRGKEKNKNKKGELPIFDNGRVRQAKILVITITELDFDTICKFYDFDFIKVGTVYASIKRYLPKILIETTLDLYSDKTTLKDVENKEIEYQNKKAKLNSLYGTCVTDILQPIISYVNGEWKNEELKGDELLKYKENVNSILLYQTGVYITAYARHELLEHNLVVGNDVVYNDTDSIKLINYEKHKKHFEEYDEKVKQQLYNMCDYYKIDKNKLNPVDIHGKNHFLGVMTDEGNYTKFKTLGCKRYIYEQNGELHATVAGIPKKSIVEYLKQFPNPFDYFNSQMYIHENISGKYTHYYTEEHEPIKIIDYTGKEEIQEVYTGISLQPQKFEINLSAEYSNFLQYNTTIDGMNHCEKLKNITNLTKVKTLWD